MTDQVDQTNVDGVSPDAAPNVDVKSVMEELEKIKSTNARLLDESNQYKNKYKSLRDEIEASKTQDLESSEKYKELYEMTQKKLAETSSQVNDFRKQSLQKDMHFKVAAKATDAHDVRDVINALPKDMLKIDEESFSVSGVEDAVAYVKQNKPWLFKSHGGTGMASSRPVQDNGQKSWSDLSQNEKDNAFADAMKDAWFS